VSQSPPYPVAITDNVVVPVDVSITEVVPSVSPSGSIRSNASIPLGSIQIDNSGNQVVNT
jgi:hypothetical protein